MTTDRPRRDLRVLADHLFDTLEQLKDGSIDIDHAKAIQGVSQTIINIATVSVKAMNAQGRADDGLGLLPAEEPKRLAPAKHVAGAPTPIAPDPRDTLQKPRRVEPAGR